VARKIQCNFDYPSPDYLSVSVNRDGRDPLCGKYKKKNAYIAYHRSTALFSNPGLVCNAHM
jgi:hypothetical protein